VPGAIRPQQHHVGEPRDGMPEVAKRGHQHPLQIDGGAGG
jgi:hypothetical protein